MRARIEPHADGRGEPDEGGRRLVLPPVESGFGQDALVREPKTNIRAPRAGVAQGAISRRRASARNPARQSRGRYAGASPARLFSSSVAVDATLRAAAGLNMEAGVDGAPAPRTASNAIRVAPEALRYKRFRGREGVLYIFLVDASGSMAANRIAQAKGALAQLLRRSYVNRDRVALVAFRATGAELLLAPSASAARARALLDALPVGGATPLASGLLRALGVARRAAREGVRQIRLVVFTDGRANVPLNAPGCTAAAPREEGAAGHKEDAARTERVRAEIQALGAALLRAGVASLVVDTQSRFTAGSEGRLLSEALGGRYVRLPQVFSEVVRVSFDG